VLRHFRFADESQGLRLKACAESGSNVAWETLDQRFVGIDGDTGRLAHDGVGSPGRRPSFSCMNANKHRLARAHAITTSWVAAKVTR